MSYHYSSGGQWVLGVGGRQKLFLTWTTRGRMQARTYSPDHTMTAVSIVMDCTDW